MTRSPYNHWRCGGTCTAPLTLADRELIGGRSMTQDDGGGPYCTGCLADLPPGYEALFHVCAPPEPAPVPAVVLAAPVFRPAKQDRFVSGFIAAWAADRDAALWQAAEYGCDPDWCTAYRWDGHHVPTCRLARQACARAGLRDELTERGYLAAGEE